MVNAKEIVKRTLDFNKPERVARSFENSDLIHCSYNVKTGATDWYKVSENRWERKDEWGNLWGRIDKSSKGEVIEGVFEDINDISGYQFPDYSNYEAYQDIEKQKLKESNKWLIGDLPGFTFSIARKLFELENYLRYLLLEPAKMRNLHDKIDKMLGDMIRNYAKAGVDSIMFWEDWGTQTHTLISPELWYKEFFFRFNNLCSIAHEKGIKVFMHSCGAIADIMPGLIKAGIDLFQFDQPKLHGIDVLASYQRENKVTFWCPIDIQQTLQSRDKRKIRKEAKELLDKLWQGEGGFIAGYYNDNNSIGLEPEWQEYACDEFIKYGKQELYI